MSGLLFTSRSWGNFGLGVGEDEDAVFTRIEALRNSLSLKSIVFMKQSHSDVVVLVNGSEDIVEADAIVTTEKGAGLAVLVGDCVPILIRGETCVAAIHAGRVGMVNGIVSNTVAVMRELGSNQFEAILGPSICADCYEVSAEMYSEVIEKVPGSSTNDESHSLDLQNGIASQLIAAGVEVLNLGICTREFPDFFSHRRSVSESEPEGRQLGLIYL